MATDGEDGIMSGLNSRLDPLMALILRACLCNHHSSHQAGIREVLVWIQYFGDNLEVEVDAEAGTEDRRKLRGRHSLECCSSARIT